MGGVGSPLCRLGGVGGGAPLETGCTGAVGAGAFVEGEVTARGDPTEGSSLGVAAEGDTAGGAEVTRGETGPKVVTVGAAGRDFWAR